VVQSVKNSLFRRFIWFLCMAAALVASACVPERLTKTEAASGKPVDSMSRADPGYLQQLYKISMLGKSAELAAIVSGSGLGWRVAGSSQNPGDLLTLAGAWVRIHPQTVLAPGQSSPLAQLGGPVVWDALNRNGIGGIYISPAGASGALWDYERERIYNDNEDVAQYDFALYLGKDDAYTGIVRTAAAFRSFLGGDIVPAATGVGPDFFLAARDYRNYAGIYCMVEVPREYWDILPPVHAEWELRPLLPSQTKALEDKGLIPSVLSQETLDFLPVSGWASTSEVRGVDGRLRRWVYRYFGDHKRPALNWADPSAAARQILSGSVVRQVGLLGNALNGFSVRPFIGLERYGQSFRFGRAEDGVGSLSGYTQAMEAAISISRQIRSYGGWSWLRDELPLPILRDFLQVAPDFAWDSVTSPAAEHALLSGNSALLRFMVDEALVLGLDFKRLVHGSFGHEGVSYLLPHLQYLKSRQADAQKIYARQVRDIRAKSMLAEKLYALTLAEAESQGSNPADPRAALPARPAAENRLSTTPAGLAAAALSLNAGGTLAEDDKILIERGHQLLIFFRAMQPGVLMLSGQDLVGLLPLNKNGLHNGSDRWPPRMAAMGSYSLLSSSLSVQVNPQGVPRAESLYGPLDTQIFRQDSFLRKLGDMLRLRNSLNLQQGELAGRLETEGRGLIALVTKIPGKERFILSLTNFSRSPSNEKLNTAEIPGLEQTLARGRVSVVYGKASHQNFTGGNLELSLAGWEGAVLVIEAD
jgi:trehalose synthase